MRAVALFTIALAVGACGSSHPRASHAFAVGLAALGTGAAVAANACVTQSDEVCGDTAVASGVAILGTAITAGALAYMDGADPDAGAPLPAPYSPVPAAP